MKMPKWFYYNLLAGWRTRGESKYLEKLEREYREDQSAGRKPNAPKDDLQDSHSKSHFDLMYGDSHGGNVV